MTTTSNRTRKIAARLSAHLTGFLDGNVNEESLVRKLRKLARDIEGEGLKPQVNVLQGAVEDAAAGRIFEHWQIRMSKPNAKFTDGRKKAVRARLAEGYSIAQIKAAIDACSSSDFHMGDNDRKTEYNDLKFICRNGETLEKFAGNDDGGEVSASVEVRQLQREADEALSRGDTAAYNTANERLREARAS